MENSWKDLKDKFGIDVMVRGICVDELNSAILSAVSSESSNFVIDQGNGYGFQFKGFIIKGGLRVLVMPGLKGAMLYKKDGEIGYTSDFKMPPCLKLNIKFTRIAYLSRGGGI